MRLARLRARMRAVPALTLVAALGCGSIGVVAPAEIQSERFAEVDRILEAAIADGAFPGAVVAVGHGGKLVHLAAFGRQTYAPDAPPDRDRHRLRHRQPDQGGGDHHRGNDPGRPRQARPRRSGRALPARLHGARQGTRDRPPPARTRLGHRLVGAALSRDRRQSGLRRAHRGDAAGRRAGSEGALQRPRHHPPRRDPRAGLGRAARSLRRRAACSGRSR